MCDILQCWYLLIFQCYMHIKVASVCGKWRKVEAPKSKRMKLKQKPCEFVLQHSEDWIMAQFSCVTKLDLPIIKGIEPHILAPAAHQCVHDMT